MRALAAALCLAPSLAWAGLDVPPAPTDTSQFVKGSDVPAIVQQNAPVTKVNGAQGQVTVPTVQQQVSSPIDISSGTATWTYPTTFVHVPTCWATVSPANATYVFAQPTITTSLTAAIVNEQAALKALSLPLGLTTFWVNPPAGTTITLSCVGALP